MNSRMRRTRQVNFSRVLVRETCSQLIQDSTAVIKLPQNAHTRPTRCSAQLQPRWPDPLPLAAMMEKFVSTSKLVRMQRPCFLGSANPLSQSKLVVMANGYWPLLRPIFCACPRCVRMARLALSTAWVRKSLTHLNFN